MARAGSRSLASHSPIFHGSASVTVEASERGSVGDSDVGFKGSRFDTPAGSRFDAPPVHGRDGARVVSGPGGPASGRGVKARCGASG
jgi:hypothetical protein